MLGTVEIAYDASVVHVDFQMVGADGEHFSESCRRVLTARQRRSNRLAMGNIHAK